MCAKDRRKYYFINLGPDLSLRTDTSCLLKVLSCPSRFTTMFQATRPGAKRPFGKLTPLSWMVSHQLSSFVNERNHGRNLDPMLNFVLKRKPDHNGRLKPAPYCLYHKNPISLVCLIADQNRETKMLPTTMLPCPVKHTYTASYRNKTYSSGILAYVVGLKRRRGRRRQSADGRRGY